MGYYLSFTDLPEIQLPTPDNLQKGNKTEDEMIMDAYNKNSFNEANRLADELLSKNQNEVNVLLLKAQTLAQEGSLTFKEKELGDKAMAYVDKALKIEPNSVRGLTLKGYIYEIQQNYVQAHKYYDLGLSLEPNNSDTLAQKAHAYDLQGKVELAKSFYEKALALDADNPKILGGYGRILILTGEREEAKEIYNKIAISTDNFRLKAESYYTLGTIVETNIYSPETEKYYQSAINSDPTLPISYVGLARELFKKSFIETDLNKKNEYIHSSFENLKKALELNPNESYAKLQTAVQILAIGNDATLAKKMLTNLEKNLDNDITLSSSDKSILRKTITGILTAQK